MIVMAVTKVSIEILGAFQEKYRILWIIYELAFLKKRPNVNILLQSILGLKACMGVTVNVLEESKSNSWRDDDSNESCWGFFFLMFLKEIFRSFFPSLY